MKKKVLYIIDDINYVSGAQKVTLFQMKEMQKIADIYLLSLTKPKETLGFLDNNHVLDQQIWTQTEMYALSFKTVMNSSKYSLKEKMMRILYAVSLRCGKGDLYFERLVEQRLRPILEQFDDIIVVSEASKLRRFVSTLERPKKIQWIHTDYARWSEFSEWSRAITRNDADIYSKYDNIVVLSDYCRQGMINKIPSLRDKIVVIPNLIDGDRILKLAKEKCPIDIPEDCLKLITVARLDKEKRIDQLLRVAGDLQDQIKFKWYIIGDGPDREELEQLKSRLKLDDCVEFLGYMENPYSVMSHCDTLVLLSKYEGTPVTIDEAMVLGLGIVAPKIGGIPEQVNGYPLYNLYTRYNEIIVDKLQFKIQVSNKNDFLNKNLCRLNKIRDII